MKFKYTIPPTWEQGKCTITGTSSWLESARSNAIGQYNEMRAHAGQEPIRKLPRGTIAAKVTG